MGNNIVKIVLSIIISGFFVFCASISLAQSRINSTTDETMKTSVEQVRNELSKDDIALFDNGILKMIEFYFHPETLIAISANRNGDININPVEELRKALNNKTAKDIIDFGLRDISYLQK